MYAVIQTGGKQYRVKPGDKVMVEKLTGSLGDKVEFGEVLLLSSGDSVSVGTPLIQGARVTGEIVEQGRLGDKLIVFKFKRRKNYRLKRGHRQEYTAIKINEVVAP